MKFKFDKKFSKYREFKDSISLHNGVSKKGKEVFWDCHISSKKGLLDIKGLDRARFCKADKENMKLHKNSSKLSIF